MLQPLREPVRPVLSLFTYSRCPPSPSSRAAPAPRAVVEPNGITVPAPPITPGCATVTCPAGRVCEDGRCEVRLQSYFDTNGEAISETADASTDPGVFLPLCDFAATLVLSESQAQGGLAWYNVPTTAPTAAPAAIYQIGPFPMLVGQVITSADVRTNPNYAGGLIGFVLLKNLGAAARCRASTTPSTSATSMHVHGLHDAGLLEDGAQLPVEGAPQLVLPRVRGLGGRRPELAGRGTTATSTTRCSRISGVTCDGGGEPCDTGMPGVCAQGVTQCQVGAGIICKPAVMQERREVRQPRQRLQRHGRRRRPACAQASFVCSKGVCIRPCDDSEFPCAVGLKCDTDGLCKDPRCADRRLPRRAGVPGRHLRRRLPGRHLSARPGLPARRLRRSVRGRVVPRRRVRQGRVRQRVPLPRLRHAARCARWAARSTATASTPAATR